MAGTRVLPLHCTVPSRMRRLPWLLSISALLAAVLVTACTSYPSQRAAGSASPAAGRPLPARSGTAAAAAPATPTPFSGQLAGDTVVTLELDLSAVPADQRDGVLQHAVTAVQRRLGLAGVQQAAVSVGNAGQILVEARGITPTDAQALLGTAGHLAFKEQSLDPSTQKPKLDASGGPVWIPACRDYGCPSNETPLTGSDLNGDAVASSDVAGHPTVTFSLTDAGAAILGAVTQRNIGQPVAIFLDDQLISAPVVVAQVTDQVEISGANVNVRQLAIELNGGELPAPVKQVQATVR